MSVTHPTTKLAVAQIPVELGDVKANLESHLAAMREAADAGARIVVFTECGLTGYLMRSAEECWEHAIAPDGEEIARIAAECDRLDLIAVVGYLERGEAEGEVRNTATLLGPNGIRADYRKVHLPYLGADRFVTPGTEPPRVVDTPIGKVGLNICYDLRFPEWARSLSLGGARIIANPTNWALAAEGVARILPPARALENAVYLLVVNRGDSERGVDFVGLSAIYGPNGQTIASVGRESGVLVSDVDLDRAQVSKVVIEPGSFELDLFGDRRPELYSAITDSRR